MDLFLRKVVHSAAPENYRVVIRDGDEIEVGSIGRQFEDGSRRLRQGQSGLHAKVPRCLGSLRRRPRPSDGISCGEKEAAVSWSRRFDEPIELPDGRKLRTLKEAIAYLAKEIPKKEHTMPKVQAAARTVPEAAENNGPMIFARMGVLRAINRHHVRELRTARKPHHWGK